MNCSGFLINHEKVKELIGKYGHDTFLKKISKFIFYYYENKQFFPYKKYFVKNIEKIFLKLREHKIEDIKISYDNPKNQIHFITDNKEMILTKSKEKDYEIDILSDYFQEHVRIECHKISTYDNKQQPSILDYWKNAELHPTWIPKILDYFDRIDSYTLRETLYKVHGNKECNQFKPTVARFVYQNLKATRILDFSAGWGDRLIAAISLEDEIEFYHGFDPNEKLFSGYEEIIDRFAKEKHKFQMTCTPFQTYSFSKYDDVRYDLVFTSPPYFDLEIYSNNESQSVQTYPHFEDWIVFFLFASIRKAWNQLGENGHLAIHITNIGNSKPYADLIHLFIQHQFYSNALFVKTILTSGGKNVIPIWIWKKVSEKNISFDYHHQLKNKSRMLFRSHYPNIWKKIISLRKNNNNNNNAS